MRSAAHHSAGRAMHGTRRFIRLQVSSTFPREATSAASLHTTARARRHLAAPFLLKPAALVRDEVAVTIRRGVGLKAELPTVILQPEQARILEDQGPHMVDGQPVRGERAKAAGSDGKCVCLGDHVASAMSKSLLRKCGSISKCRRPFFADCGDWALSRLQASCRLARR